MEQEKTSGYQMSELLKGEEKSQKRLNRGRCLRWQIRKLWGGIHCRKRDFISRPVRRKKKRDDQGATEQQRTAVQGFAHACRKRTSLGVQ